MRRRLDTAQLRRIVLVRELQRFAAEAEAAHAAAALREQEVRLQEAEVSRAAAADHWDGLHAQDALPLDLVALWTHAVQQEDENLQAVAEAVKDTVAIRDERLKDFHALEQREQMAEDMLDIANRDRARTRDEKAVQNAADHHLQNRGAP